MFVIKILSKIINARITLIKILFLRFLKGSLKKKLFRTKFSKINSNFIANYRDYHFLKESLKYYISLNQVNTSTFLLLYRFFILL